MVKLAHSTRDWLLAHKSVLQACLPMMAPMLRPEWGHPRIVHHPISNQDMELYTLSLRVVDNTIVLSERKDVALPRADS